MPRKGAVSAAPTGGTDDPWGSAPPAKEPNTEQDTEAAKEPARRGGRKTAEERAADRAAANGDADSADTAPDGGFEDWTKPAYADDPGEFVFGSLDDDTEYLSIMWWGKEGTGKTTNLARVAATKLASVVKGDVLMINAEGGAKRTPLRKHGIDTSRFKTYPRPGEVLTFEGLERLYYRLAADLEKDPESWGAVCWDSITAIHEKLLDNVIEAEMRKQAEILQRAKKNRAGRSGNIVLRDRFETEGDDYGQMTNQVKLLLRKYRTLPCHFLVTALERRDEDRKRKGAKPHYGPAVSPALATALLGYVDIVIRTHVLDENVYYGRTTPTEDSRGKDRMFSLPVELVDPTFDRVYGYIHGELEHETDRAQRRMPGGAEGTLVRRSLADEDAEVDHVREDGAPLSGGEDTPEPPKTGRRRSAGPAASSGRTRASAPESAPAPEETTPNEGESLDPPRTGGRKPARSRTAAAATETVGDDSGSVQDSPPVGTNGKAAPKRGGRKTAAERTAKAEVQADTEPSKSSGTATRAAAERAKKAAEANGDYDEPPF